MSRRVAASPVVFSLALTLLSALLFASTAAGAVTPSFSHAVGAALTAAPDVCVSYRDCEAGSTGAGSAAIAGAGHSAVSGDDIYVLDDYRHRVSVFTTAGTFVRAFGDGVDAATGGDVCTTACQAGVAGSGAGQLGSSARSLAVGGGEVFVAGNSNDRVDVFSTDGVFLRAFGEGVDSTSGADVCTTSCRAGQPLTGDPDQISDPLAIAYFAGEVYLARSGSVSVFGTDGSYRRVMGNAASPASAGGLGFVTAVAVTGTQVFVADRTTRRVNEFTTAGTFVRAFGRQVDSITNANVCTSNCKAGAASLEPGGLMAPDSLAISGGEVFVGDTDQRRINVFNATNGAFARALGKLVDTYFYTDSCTSTCGYGLGGTPGGYMYGVHGLSVADGQLHVSDGNARISVLGTDGAFARAYGKSVRATTPFICTTNCSTGEAGSDYGQLSNPGGIAVGSSEIFVADEGNHRISKHYFNGQGSASLGAGVNADTMFQPHFRCSTVCKAGLAYGAAGSLSSPKAVALGSDLLYVADSGHHRISVMDVNGVWLRAFGKDVGGAGVNTCTSPCVSGVVGSGAGELSSPSGVAVAGGEVFVIDANDRVSVFSINGTLLRTFSGPGTASGLIDDATAITVSGGEVFVADAGNDRVSIFSTSGDFLRAISELPAAGGVAVSGDRVYVTDGGRVAQYTRAGTFVREFGTAGDGAGQLGKPRGIALSADLAFVAEGDNHRVSAFTVDGPEITASPTTLAFGSQPVSGGPTTVLASVVTNTGNTAVNVQASWITGTDTNHFFVNTALATDCKYPKALAVGASCNVRVTFDPLTAGAKSATLTVTTFGGQTASIALAGTGTEPAPTVTALAAAPTSLSFAERDTSAGPSAAQTSTVTNTGDQPVTLTGLTLSGTHPGDFERLSGESTDCTPTTQLAAAATCALRVRFDPTATGVRDATVTVTSNAPQIAIALTGTGSAAAAPVQKTLTVTRNGAGTITGGGIDCGAVCTMSAPAGTTVQLTATPAAGYTFAGFSGPGACSGNPCSVTLNESLSLAATFTANQTSGGTSGGTTGSTTTPPPTGPNGFGSSPPDSDFDGVANASDKCPTVAIDNGVSGGADPANPGCPKPKLQIVLYKYIDLFRGKKYSGAKPAVVAIGIPRAKTVAVSLTLSAGSAKAAKISKRRIASTNVVLSGTVDRTNFVAPKVSAANVRKLKKLKTITVTYLYVVTLATGEKKKLSTTVKLTPTKAGKPIDTVYGQKTNDAGEEF